MAEETNPLSWRQQRPVSGFQSFRSFGPKSHRTCGVCWVARGQVLLVRQRGTHQWGFPKGSKHPHETQYDCMVRELHEETGLVLADYRPVLLHQQQFRPGTVYFFTLDVDPSTLPLNPQDAQEIEQVAWLPLSQLGHCNLNCITKYVYRTLLCHPDWQDTLLQRARRGVGLKRVPPGAETGSPA